MKIKEFIKNNKAFVGISSFYIAANIADVITTNIGMCAFGTDAERNYILRHVMDNYGMDMFNLSKGGLENLMIVGGTYILSKNSSKLKKIAYGLMVGGGILYSGVAISNIVDIFR